MWHYQTFSLKSRRLDPGIRLWKVVRTFQKSKNSLKVYSKVFWGEFSIRLNVMTELSWGCSLFSVAASLGGVQIVFHWPDLAAPQLIGFWWKKLLNLIWLQLSYLFTNLFFSEALLFWSDLFITYYVSSFIDRHLFFECPQTRCYADSYILKQKVTDCYQHIGL